MKAYIVTLSFDTGDETLECIEHVFSSKKKAESYIKGLTHDNDEYPNDSGITYDSCGMPMRSVTLDEEGYEHIGYHYYCKCEDVL